MKAASDRETAIPGRAALAEGLTATLPRHALVRLGPVCLALFGLLLVATCAVEHPRLDADEEPVTRYIYRVPDELDDDWATASLDEAGIAEAPIVRLVEGILIRDFPNIHSILLVKDGKLVLEEYFYGYDRERLHELHSVSKSVTSVLVGIAVDRGFIANLDWKVSTYFPDYWRTHWVAEDYDVTIRHLLTMSAGVAWNETSRPVEDWRNDILAMLKSRDWVRYVLQRKRVEPPGQTYNYNGGLTILLGEILHRTSRLSADAFAEKHLFAPLGITTYRWHRNGDGTINTQGGLSLRPRDLAKIGYMMLKGGLWKERRILSEPWVAASTRPHIETAPGGWGYGYQWYRIDTEFCGRIIEAFAAIGRGGQYIVAAPALDQMAVFTSEPYDNEERLYLPLALLKKFVLPATMPQESCR